MKMRVALGIAGGFLLGVRGWIGLLILLWAAGRLSQGQVLALLRGVLDDAGW